MLWPSSSFGRVGSSLLGCGSDGVAWAESLRQRDILVKLANPVCNKPGFGCLANTSRPVMNILIWTPEWPYTAVRKSEFRVSKPENRAYEKKKAFPPTSLFTSFW
jgi:hypothetical protein